jgi:hypothetical protein
MLLQSVMAKTHFAQKSRETSGFAVLKSRQTRSSKKPITGLNKQKQTYNHF